MEYVVQQQIFQIYEAILKALKKNNSSKDIGEKSDEINIDNIRGAKILLVEDNEINQQVAKENLENEDFWVDVAENGMMAIEKINEKNYDLVLMDLQMPVLDGHETTIKIRDDARFIGLPIIALSADAMEGTNKLVIDIGMNDYITKPIDRKRLFETIPKWKKPEKRVPYIAIKEELIGDEIRESLINKLQGFDVE